MIRRTTLVTGVSCGLFCTGLMLASCTPSIQQEHVNSVGPTSNGSSVNTNSTDGSSNYTTGDETTQANAIDSSSSSDATAENNSDASVTPQGVASSLNGGSHTAVGLLFQHDQATNWVQTDCTGTLVKTATNNVHNVVLTAKHCGNMDSFYIGAGESKVYPQFTDWQSVANTMVAYKVIAVVSVGSGNVEDGPCPRVGVDQELLILDRPVTGVEPMLISSHAPAVGAICEFVGFGCRVAADGTISHLLKSSFSVTIGNVLTAAVQETDITNGVPGRGDSGGPLICNGQLSATDSCGNGYPNQNIDQAFVRTDANLAAIDKIISGWVQSGEAQ